MWISCGKLTSVEVLRSDHNSMGYSCPVQFFLFGVFLPGGGLFSSGRWAFFFREVGFFLPGGGLFRRFFLPVKIPVFG